MGASLSVCGSEQKEQESRGINRGGEGDTLQVMQYNEVVAIADATAHTSASVVLTVDWPVSKLTVE